MNERFSFGIKGTRDFYFAVCVLGFVIGSVFGVVSAGVRPDLFEAFDAGIVTGFGFFRRLLVSSIPFFATAVLGTSVFGVFLVPVVALFRGLCFSYSVSVFFSCGNSLISAFFPFGLTAFVLIPAFIVLSCEACCYASALRLLKLNAVPRSQVGIEGKYFVNTLIFAAAVLAAVSAVSMFLMPS